VGFAAGCARPRRGADARVRPQLGSARLVGRAVHGERPATGDGDDYEIVLYVPLTGAAVLLDDLCRSVVDVGVSQELLLSSGAYAQLAFAGKVPDLLSAIGTLSVIGAPRFEPAHPSIAR